MKNLAKRRNVILTGVVLLLALGAVVVYSQSAPPSEDVSVADAIVLSCSLITLNPDPSSMTLQYDSTGAVTAQSMSLEIIVQGRTDFSASSGYRIAYCRGEECTFGLGGNTVQQDITFELTNPAETDANKRIYQTNPNPIINIDGGGKWNYTVEARSNSLTVNGSGPGCPNGQKWVSFNVNVSAPPADQIYDRICPALATEQTINHFTCRNDGSDGVGGNVWIPMDINCSAGFTADETACRAGKAPNGSSLGTGGSGYCLPCTDPNNQKTQIDHLQPCDPNSTTSECDKSKQGLECVATNNSNDTNTTRHRCLYTNSSVIENERCYIGAAPDECRANDGFTRYSCQVTDSTGALTGYLGTCTSVENSFACSGTEDPHPSCTEELGVDAVCEGGICVAKSTLPPPAEDPDDPSTDFGPRNCPFAEPICVASAACTEDNATCRGLASSCEKDPSRGRFKQDPNSALSRSEQLQQFRLCTWCIRDDGGTWTEAFGCIITTPEGVFTALIRISLGVLGGIALLRITYLGIITAQSKDENKIAEAKKGVIATLGGIAIVILSVLILRVIGVNVLDIVPPGFF